MKCSAMFSKKYKKICCTHNRVCLFVVVSMICTFGFISLASASEAEAQKTRFDEQKETEQAAMLRAQKDLWSEAVTDARSAGVFSEKTGTLSPAMPAPTSRGDVTIYIYTTWSVTTGTCPSTTIDNLHVVSNATLNIVGCDVTINNDVTINGKIVTSDVWQNFRNYVPNIRVGGSMYLASAPPNNRAELNYIRTRFYISGMIWAGNYSKIYGNVAPGTAESRFSHFAPNNAYRWSGILVTATSSSQYSIVEMNQTKIIDADWGINSSYYDIYTAQYLDLYNRIEMNDCQFLDPRYAVTLNKTHEDTLSMQDIYVSNLGLHGGSAYTGLPDTYVFRADHSDISSSDFLSIEANDATFVQKSAGIGLYNHSGNVSIGNSTLGNKDYTEITAQLDEGSVDIFGNTISNHTGHLSTSVILVHVNHRTTPLINKIRDNNLSGITQYKTAINVQQDSSDSMVSVEITDNTVSYTDIGYIIEFVDYCTAEQVSAIKALFLADASISGNTITADFAASAYDDCKATMIISGVGGAEYAGILACNESSNSPTLTISDNSVSGFGIGLKATWTRPQIACNQIESFGIGVEVMLASQDILSFTNNIVTAKNSSWYNSPLHLFGSNPVGGCQIGVTPDGLNYLNPSNIVIDSPVVCTMNGLYSSPQNVNCQ